MRRGPSLALLTVLLFAYISQSVLTQAPRALEVSRGLARRHLDDIAAKRGKPEHAGRRDLRAWIDEDGKSHHHVQQLHRGVPVMGGEAIVQLSPEGELEVVTDDFIDHPEPFDVTPTLTATEAINFAVAAAGVPADALTADPSADLWIVPGEPDRLTYRVQLRREDGSLETSMPVVFIDAQDGSVVSQYDNLQTASVVVTGTSNYYGLLSLAGYTNGTTYYIEDLARKLGVFTFNNGTSSIFRASDADGVYNAANQKAMIDAGYAVTSAYDYFKNVHGRNGIDGSGGPAYATSADGVTGLISSMVHYSTNYNNAFWNGQYMTYGDGDGSTFSSLTTLDIGAHELTHGVTERTAALVYANESGALNESMSDVFAALVDRHTRGENVNTYRIGEEAYTPANGTGDALRYMDTPHSAGNSGFTSDDDPDHYSERYTGTADNGGVHINSGIANKAFYLVAKGGSHHLGGTMTGIGADAAGAIWYKALTTYMTSNTNFAGARTATLNAAAAIYGNGSTNYNAVCQAWSMVGVGSSCTAPPPPPTGGTPLLLNSGFETSLTPWVSSGTGALYTANGSSPHSGTGYIYFGAANSVSGQVYQQTTIPAGTSKTLSFYLNITSAETTTTTQYDKLFVEVRNSAGALLATLATYSNLNKVATAGAYTARSLSLAPYAGQTIRIQFRATTDSSAITTFRIDDACIDACSTSSSGPTSTTAAVSNATPVYGTPVTFTATVAGSGACTDPAGTVAFTDGGTTLGTVTLNASNQAALTTSALTGGSHTIQATFSSSTSTCTGSSGSVGTTVSKADQTITFGVLGNKTFGDAPFTVSATASSTLPVTFSIASGPATISGSTVTITGTGPVTVRASQTGNGNYLAAAPVDRLFTVAKANQDISFGALANKTFGDAAFGVSATASSNLPVTFTIASGPATISGSTVTITGTGLVTVRASQAGNANYLAATPVDRSFTVAKASQTISFGLLADKKFGDPAFGVSATATSSLPVSFSIVSGPATINGSTITLTGVGTVTVRAAQGGDGNYTPAPNVDRVFAVGKGNQSITFNALANKTFGDAPFGLSATASSNLAVTFSVVSGPATLGAGNLLTLTGAGPVTVRASQAGNADFNPAADVDRSFTVAKRDQAIAFAALPGKTFGDEPFAIGATSSAGLAVSLSVVSGPASLGPGNVLTLTGAGAVTIRASQSGDPNTNAAMSIERSFNVAKGVQTIAFAALSGRTFGDPPFTVSATATSGLPVSFSIVSGGATIAGNTLTLVGTGTVVVRASQAGSANYEAAPTVDRSFDVLKASQTITFAAPANKAFGDAPFALSATASSNLAVAFSVVSGPATLGAGNVLTLTGAGTVTVRASQIGNTHYEPATDVERSFTVAPRDQTITFAALPNKTFGDPAFALTASTDAGLAVGFTVLSGPATLGPGNILTLTGAGAVTIRASQSGDANTNAAAPVDRSFSVAQGPQTIAFAPLSNKAFGDPPFTVSATATSGLPVAFSIVSGDATIAGSTITLLGTGTVVVRASQAGNTDYLAAPAVDRPFEVLNANQTITFDALANKTFGDAPFTVSATATSGLAVTFSIVSGPATIAGNLVTLTGAGTVVVRASQAGDEDYSAAADVDRSFTVEKADQSITFDALADRTFGDAPFGVGATATSNLPVSFSIVSGPATLGAGNVVTLTGAGAVTIRASQAGDANTNAAMPIDRSFTVARGSQTIAFDELTDRSFGEPPFTVSATASSGLPVAFSIVSGDATIAGSTITLGGTGTVVVRAAQAGNVNYEAAPPVDRAFDILKASQSITFGALADRTFGDAPFAVGASASSGLAVTFSIVSGAATITGDVVTITGAGPVVVRASQAGDDNYSAAGDVDRPFNVAKAGQSITFGAVGDRTFGDAPFGVGATATSNLAVSFSIVSGPATITGSTVAISGAGTVVVRASQDGDSNYAAAADVDQSFTVNKADQAITFDPLGDKLFGDAPFAIGATAGSGLPVSFSILSGPATLGAGNVVTITGAGTVTIRASQGGNANYHAANDIDRAFTIGRPAQTIDFNALGDVTYGAAPMLLTASASSGLPVDLAVVSGPASIAGNVLSVTGAGSIVVRASQAGDANHLAAEPVDRSFTSAPAPLVVSITSASRGYWDVDQPLNGSINGLVNGDLIGAVFSANTTSESPAGTYPIAATLVDPANRLSHYSLTVLPGNLTIVNPAPAITSLAPTSVALGGGDLLLELHGQDFVPQTSVSMDGTPLPTTFVSRTLVRVTLSAGSLSAVGVKFLTAAQSAPGGGVTAPAEFFVTNTGAPVVDADTDSSDDESGTAEASVGGSGPGTPDSISVSAAGEGSVTVAQFEDNPGPPVTFQSTDAFFDVFVPPSSSFTSLTILSCDLNGGNLVLWSDGTAWMPASHQSFDPGTGCVTILVDDQTSPSLSQLTGTYFVAATDVTAPATAASATQADGSGYTFGAWANGPVTVALHATDNAGGAGVTSLSSSASGATTIPETTVPGANGLLTISAEGETTIAFRATDGAGNVEGVQTRTVRIDRQSPAASAEATPGALWPPNGKKVAVTISGRLSDATGIAAASYAVADEYGEVTTTGAVTVAADGSYRFTVMLPASRRGDDTDGRTFAVRVDATDRAGNFSTAEALVVVPHSQGK